MKGKNRYFVVILIIGVLLAFLCVLSASGASYKNVFDLVITERFSFDLRCFFFGKGSVEYFVNTVSSEGTFEHFETASVVGGLSYLCVISMILLLICVICSILAMVTNKKVFVVFAIISIIIAGIVGFIGIGTAIGPQKDLIITYQNGKEHTIKYSEYAEKLCVYDERGLFEYFVICIFTPLIFGLTVLIKNKIGRAKSNDDSINN